MPSATSWLSGRVMSSFCPSSASNLVSYTCMRFCVSVPVLSVQMTVTAPMVSQACILRTRLFVASIRRMFSARLSVTLIGSPSGTVTTMSVTAIMKLWSTIFAMSRYSVMPLTV